MHITIRQAGPSTTHYDTDLTELLDDVQIEYWSTYQAHSEPDVRVLGRVADLCKEIKRSDDRIIVAAATKDGFFCVLDGDRIERHTWGAIDRKVIDTLQRCLNEVLELTPAQPA